MVVDLEALGPAEVAGLEGEDLAVEAVAVLEAVARLEVGNEYYKTI